MPLQALTTGGCPTPDLVGLRLATFNILADCFPWVIRLAIDSEARFEALVEEVCRVDADVLLLNEVTSNSLSVLLGSEFVRRSYYVSELPSDVNGTLGGSHGCVLLSKIPLARCYALHAEPMKRRAILGVIPVGSRNIAVCSLHTLAQQTPRNKAVRAKQIARLAEVARQQAADGFLIAGDLNLHYISEDGVIPANGLLDAWAETHFGEAGDADPGFTFDAEANTLIPRYIPGEVRRMRLDRILASEGICLVPSGPCQLWGTQAVDARRDVFLSDHFGLVQDFRLDEGGWRGDASVGQRLLENANIPLEEHPVSTPRFCLALAAHVPWLTLRALSYL